MITLFSTHKNFTGIFDIIQTNALNNWRSISPDIQIIIIGNSKGSKEIASSINADYVPEVKCSPEGTPLLEDLFRIAQSRARNPIMTYVNADIILPKNFLSSINIVSKYFKKFLMIGNRWDLDVNQSINYNNNNETTNFWNMARKKSQKHGCSGIDYFVFRKGMYSRLPNFAVGRWGWDNWLIWKARRHMLPVIDATEDIQVIHQNHSYQFHHITSIEDSKTGSEFRLNEELVGNKHLNILDSTHALCRNNIFRKNDKESKIRNLHRLPAIFPELAIPIKIYRRLYKRFL